MLECIYTLLLTKADLYSGRQYLHLHLSTHISTETKLVSVDIRFILPQYKYTQNEYYLSLQYKYYLRQQNCYYKKWTLLLNMLQITMNSNVSWKLVGCFEGKSLHDRYHYCVLNLVYQNCDTKLHTKFVLTYLVNNKSHINGIYVNNKILSSIRYTLWLQISHDCIDL